MFNKFINSFMPPTTTMAGVISSLGDSGIRMNEELVKIKEQIRKREIFAEETKQEIQKLKDITINAITNELGKRIKEKFWDNVLNSVTPYIVVVDDCFNIIQGNKRFQDLNSNNKESLLNVLGTITNSNEFLATIDDTFHYALNNSEDNFVEIQDLENGNWYFVSMFPIPPKSEMEKQKADYCLIMFRDITTRVKYILDNEKEKRFYKAILDNQSDYIIRLDGDLNVKFLNKSLCDFLDVEDESKAEGLNIIDLFKCDNHFVNSIIEQLNLCSREHPFFYKDFVIKKNSKFYSIGLYGKVFYNGADHFIEVQLEAKNKTECSAKELSYTI